MFNEVTRHCDWTRILHLFPRYDFYHTWDYHNIARNSDTDQPVLYFATEANQIFAIPLLRRHVVDNIFDLTSVYGYAGPIARGDSTWIADCWEKFLLFLEARGFPSLFSRLNYFTCPTICLPRESTGSTVFLDLTNGYHNIQCAYRSGHQYDLKRSRKLGARVFSNKDSSFIQEFKAIYDSTMRQLGADDSYIFADSYYSKFISSSDFDGKMYFCEYKGKLISCALFSFCNGIAQYHLSGTLNDFYKVAPSKLLLDYAIQDAISSKLKIFHLGGGVGGKFDNLLDFKMGFGGQVIPFYVQKVILDHALYRDLVNRRVNSSTQLSGVIQKDFFPEYRSQ